MVDLSLKLDESVFRETELVLSKIKKPRNQYINEAISYYNMIQRRKLIEIKLYSESKLVADDSLSVLSDFEEIDYGSEEI